ncbi:MAG: alpha/beta hydrolase family protein, partial [Planctomycetota bacterium]
GQIELQQMMKLGMTVALAETPGGNWVGHVDIPAQMTFGFVLADLEGDGRAFNGILPGPVPAVLEIAIDETGRRLTGTMTQGPYVLAIDFPRHEGYVGSRLRRPQHPKPPYPYGVEAVTIDHPDGHRLAGTLTIPDPAAHGPGPHPAAVLVSGSGPQDRDETVFGHKPFLVIADALTRAGVAVLRYDDRGTAESTGDFTAATSEDFASDAAAAVHRARGHDAVDARRVGVIGHSEGGLIAPMVARRDADLAFVVLLSGPAVPGTEILLLQAEKILRAEGADEATITRNRERQEQIFALLAEDHPDDERAEALRVMLAEAIAELGEFAQSPQTTAAIDAQVEQLTAPWMRFFLAYDPRPALAAVPCPLLAMNGTLDLQVWHEQNLDEIERVRREAGRPVTIRRPDGLNHLFQPATTGAVSEYVEIETTFDEAALRELVEWVAATIAPEG